MKTKLSVGKAGAVSPNPQPRGIPPLPFPMPSCNSVPDSYTEVSETGPNSRAECQGKGECKYYVTPANSDRL